jgi:signal transduction histidine kinase
VDLGQGHSFGFDRGSHWFSLTLNNTSQRPDWLLEVAYAPLDRVTLYYPDASGHWQQTTLGDRFPLSERKYKNRHPVFDLHVPAGSQQTFYLQVVTTSSVQVPLVLWSPHQFNEFNYSNQFAHGLFYGLMLIMVFYNLFLFISIRDQTTLKYAFAIVAGTNVVAFFQGYGYFYLYPEHPAAGQVFSAVSGPLFVVGSVGFTRSFLLLKLFSFKLDRTLLAVAIVNVLVAACILFFEGPYTARSLHLLALLNFVLILVSAFYCFHKRYRPARYFLMAWLALLLIGVLFSLRNMGVIQNNWFTTNGLYLGGIMQTLLISFALGDRINLLRSENERARERELMREQDAKEKLEEEVRLRTEEIKIQRDQLQTTNALKDKLFSILSHDLKGPLNSLRGALGIWRLGALKPDELEKLTNQISVQLQHTTDFLDNLLQWAKSQMQGEKVHPEAIQLAELLETSQRLLLPDLKKKDVEVKTNVSVDCYIFADRSMVQTVIRNLLSNALKFSYPGGTVEVAATEINGAVIVSVKDHGVGIPKAMLEDVFTLRGVSTSGTREEKGTGIGLVLCKEFVDRNNGKIEVESEEGKGSEFRVTLPAAQKPQPTTV